MALIYGNHVSNPGVVLLLRHLVLSDETVIVLTVLNGRTVIRKRNTSIPPFIKLKQ